MQSALSFCHEVEMTIQFVDITMEYRGLPGQLLHASYAALVAEESPYWAGLSKQLTDFDDEVFNHIATVGRCAFLSMWEKTVVGFASFDPRPYPDHGIIGHHCVLPSYHMRGIGRRQIEEVLSRFRRMGMRRAIVSTSVHPFFSPARRTYQSCGFEESRRFAGGPDPRYAMIEYVRDLQAKV
jgi:GNAT superfamily N-acetyltransferase